MPSHTHKEQRNTVTLCSPLVGFESSLYYYVTRSHRLHLVHHKWTDVIEKGATGPLDSLLTFVDYDGYSISSKGFLPTVVDIMVI